MAVKRTTRIEYVFIHEVIWCVAHHASVVCGVVDKWHESVGNPLNYLNLGRCNPHAVHVWNYGLFVCEKYGVLFVIVKQVCYEYMISGNHR